MRDTPYALPKVGATVFNIDGREAEYVAFANGKHVVLPFFIGEDGDGDEYRFKGDAESWEAFFIKPPTEKLDKEVAAMQEQLNALNLAVPDAEGKLYQIQREADAARKRIAARPDLVDLDLWMRGEVTHIVALDGYGFEIGTVDEVLLDRDKELRLLCLKVDPRANRFSVTHAAYSDGSGRQTSCLLATSFEHAKERAAEYMLSQLRRGDRQDYTDKALARSAAKYGLAVPADLQAKVDKEDRENKTSRLERARASLERAKAELAAIEAQP